MSEERIDALERQVRDLMQDVASLSEELSRHRLSVPRSVVAPTPSSVTRGVLFLTEGASGAADTVKVVLKSAADTYSAVTVSTG